MAPTQFLNATCINILTSQHSMNFTSCLPEPYKKDNLAWLALVVTIARAILECLGIGLMAFMLGMSYGQKSLIKRLRNHYHSYELHRYIENWYLQIMGQKETVQEIEGRYTSVTHVDVNGIRTITIVEDCSKTPNISQKTDDWKRAARDKEEARIEKRKAKEEKKRHKQLRKQCQAPSPEVQDRELEGKERSIWASPLARDGTSAGRAP